MKQLSENYKTNECKPIRVAQIIGKMWAGGVESVVFNYYRAINKNKVQFDFFYDEDSTVEPPQDLIEMGARFYKMPPYQKIFLYTQTLKKILKKNDYKIIHSHLNTISVIPLFAAWEINLPVRIAHSHSVPGGNEWKRNILKGILKHFSKLFSTHYFACSEKAGRWLFGNLSYDNGRVNLMRNAIDFEKFRFTKEKREKVRCDLCIEDKLVIAHIGRFTYAKNHKFLLKIYAEIYKKYPESVLLLIGDGELRSAIYQMIDGLDLKKNIILIGKTSTPEYYYPAIDIMIMPSIFEGLSLTTIECQVSKTPVLISEAIPDEAIISNGVIRCSLKNNATFWANTCIELLGKEVELLAASKKYNINERAEELCKWYVRHYDQGRRENNAHCINNYGGI